MNFKDLAVIHNISQNIIKEECGIKIKNTIPDVNWNTYMILGCDRNDIVDKFIDYWILNELCIKNIDYYTNIIDIFKKYPNAHVYFGYKDDKAQEFYFDKYSFEYNDTYTKLIQHNWKGFMANYQFKNEKVKQNIAYFETILGGTHSDTLIVNKNHTWYMVWDYMDIDEELYKKISTIIKKYTKQTDITLNKLYHYKNSGFKFVRIAFSDKDPSKLNIYFKI